jgi:hypothetical protein
VNLPISDADLDAVVGRALRAEPAPGINGDFRAAVLARAELAAVRRARRRRQGLSLVAGACVVAVGLGAWSLEVAAERASRRAAMVDEHRRLQSELEELRALADRRSRISLGGDESTDLYLDLTKIPAGAADGRTTPTTRSPG